MQVELTKDYVVYQGQTRLLELGVEIAESKSLGKAETKEKIARATSIRLWLKALTYSTYLTKNTIDKLVFCLADLCDANAIPYAPVITSVDPPSILVGIQGEQGEQGEEGPEGGGIPFSSTSLTIDTIVDSFPITDARGVEYTLNIYDDSGSDMRIMRIQGGWSANGSDYGDDGGIGTTIRGDTSPVTMSIVVTGSTVQLFAAITSGTWTIEGTRKYVPNNGNGIINPTTLADGRIWVGNSSASPTPVVVSGDITLSNAGVAAIASGVIVNADVNASAAIAVSKLAAMTASRAVVTDSSGFLTTSATTATQVGYLSNVTSDIQAQIDSKVSGTGAISTVVTSDLTANRAVIANALGKIAVSSVTSTELGYVSGVTSALQTQLNSKLNLSGGTLTGGLVLASGVNIDLQGAGTITLGATGAIAAVSGSATGQFPGGISTQSPATPYFKFKTVQIGDWDMQGISLVNVAHGLSDFTKIRIVEAIIRNDANTILYNLRVSFTNAGVVTSITGAIEGMDATNITLTRTNAGFFNSTDFNATSYNRGWVTIMYEA